MNSGKSEMLIKIIWVGLIISTIFIFGSLTFSLYTIGNIVKNSFTIWNLITPNIIATVILILYTKEILFGYTPKSKIKNLKSLVFYSLPIFCTTISQLHIFEIILEDDISENWEIKVALIVILTSYIGLIMNRILKYKTF